METVKQIDTYMKMENHNHRCKKLVQDVCKQIIDSYVQKLNIKSENENFQHQEFQRNKLNVYYFYQLPQLQNFEQNLINKEQIIFQNKNYQTQQRYIKKLELQSTKTIIIGILYYLILEMEKYRSLIQHHILMIFIYSIKIQYKLWQKFQRQLLKTLKFTINQVNKKMVIHVDTFFVIL
ncbi:unnamed protein product [Paramecium sonneborni]|uniref:Uncharacterized protein n=1 Tax=Paramecium sonneborni TaxID=65129 RepID=A0A8S1QCF6_9CILI|nr:unnamed protein product [Paramecium sonneborni]